MSFKIGDQRLDLKNTHDIRWTHDI